VTLIIHGEVCDDSALPRSMIAGNISTETELSVSGVDVELMSNNPEYPRNFMTEVDGEFAFDDNIMYTSYDITADKDDNYLNGVSTLDLVFMQQHVLGIKLFDSHYKSIAADINSDEKVSAIDIVELRKLILGLYEELPNNKSWRIVDPEFTQEIDKPFPYSENIHIDHFDVEEMNEDFIAVKIGDVNGTATTNLHNNVVESRSGESIEFILEINANGNLEVRAGNNFDGVYGFQFIAKPTGNLQSIVSKSLHVNESNMALTKSGMLAFSYHSSESLNFNEGTLLFELEGIQTLTMANGHLQNEAYVSDSYDKTMINFRGQLSDLTAYALYQNEPNPFNNFTTIQFNQAEKGNASLTIFDLSGKKIKSFTQVFEKGLNSIQLSKEELGTTGVLYYRYESGDFIASKKMILIE